LCTIRVKRKPTWGTCAGLILLAESANRTKKGGQELIGGLDVRVNRNHFGRQVESFTADIDLPFLHESEPGQDSTSIVPFHAVFIRAPIVEKTLPHVKGIQTAEAQRNDTIVAPSRKAEETVPESFLNAEVDIMATLPKTANKGEREEDDIIVVKQGNCFGTSFHPELTNDPRIHIWWLKTVLETVKQ
jgi:5'-phosphate synthase pdxT subunit